MTAPTLTDRYVHAVVRELPEGRREELARELRSTIADLVDAELDRGATAATAEHAALESLGHPNLLASNYATGPQHLIGPRFFGVWQRLVRNLLTFVPAIVGSIALIADFFESDADVGSAVVSGLAAAAMTAIQILFWTTLCFAIIERTGGADEVLEWSPDRLPDLPDTGRRGVTLGDAVGSASFSLVLVALLGLQHEFAWFGDGERVPLLNPDLWSGVLPFLIVMSVLSAALEVVKYRRGWSWGVVAAVVVTSVGFSGVLALTALDGRLLSPAFIDAVSMSPASVDLTHNLVAIGAILVAAWEIGEAVFKTATGWGDRRPVGG